MPRDPLEPEKCARLLAALAAPERLRIVRVLVGGPRCVGDLADAADVKLLNVSHHLMVLKGVGLIRGTRRGRSILYTLRPGLLAEVVEAGIPRDALNLGCCQLALPPGACDRPEGKT